jgi:hypothetical protein
VPNTLRRLCVCVVIACTLAAAGGSFAASSVGSPHARKAAAGSAKTQTKTLCGRASSVRKAVIKKYTKLYTQKYTKQYGKKKGKEKGRKLGQRKPGRDICRDGLEHGKKPSKPKKLDYLHTLQRLKNPPPRAASASPSSAPAPSANAPGADSGPLAGIAACESGGSPTAVSPGGKYRGKYQFDRGTWASVGGTGDPAAASEAEQDSRAAILYSRAGASPWPICGR